VRRIGEALHVPRVAILLNEGGTLTVAHAIGFDDAPRVTIPAESWLHAAGDAERRALLQLHSELALPLSLNQKLVGVMSLGPKRSEEPFSPSDLRLLGSVAMQTGLALENSRLTTQVGLQIAEREKQRRELEIAREVQERLFPQDLPGPWHKENGPHQDRKAVPCRFPDHHVFVRSTRPERRQHPTDDP